mgnify:CR=1 FL=1
MLILWGAVVEHGFPGQSSLTLRQALALGIVPTVRHADYIGSWLDVLREDNRAIVRAASQASKAADWLLGFVPSDGAELSAESAIDRRAA